MKLLAKFNLVFCWCSEPAWAWPAFCRIDSCSEMRANAVVQQARLIMETMRSARDYTTKQIKPLLQNQQEHLRAFLPQTVPAYAATESFHYRASDLPEYEYKEAALNPTNLRDRAVDWEADVINHFRNHAGERTDRRARHADRPLALSGQADRRRQAVPGLPRPPGRAPASLIRHYGSANGFGWKEDEVIGAQIVSVPMAVPIRMADVAFRDLLVYLVAIFLVSMILLDILLVLTIVRPAARLAAIADQVSTGNLDAPELAVTGKDEISVLAGSFNRMRLSLVEGDEAAGRRVTRVTNC